MADRGLLIVFSGPSGVGKGTVRREILRVLRINFNTLYRWRRAQRPGEVDGLDYFFRTREEFEELIRQGQMLEYAEYVTTMELLWPMSMKLWTRESMSFLRLKCKEPFRLRKKVPDAVFIFLTPPDLDELQDRLVGRGTDSAEVIAQRIEKSQEEIALMREYDYAIVNDQVPLCWTCQAWSKQNTSVWTVSLVTIRRCCQNLQLLDKL